jgi:hypothetical protein
MQYYIYAHNALEHLWLPSTPHFSHRRKWYCIYACITKLYDILKISNGLLTSVCYVTTRNLVSHKNMWGPQISTVLPYIYIYIYIWYTYIKWNKYHLCQDPSALSVSYEQPQRAWVVHISVQASQNVADAFLIFLSFSGHIVIPRSSRSITHNILTYVLKYAKRQLREHLCWNIQISELHWNTQWHQIRYAPISDVWVSETDAGMPWWQPPCQSSWSGCENTAADRRQADDKSTAAVLDETIKPISILSQYFNVLRTVLFTILCVIVSYLTT